MVLCQKILSRTEKEYVHLRFTSNNKLTENGRELEEIHSWMVRLDKSPMYDEGWFTLKLYTFPRRQIEKINSYRFPPPLINKKIYGDCYAAAFDKNNKHCNLTILMWKAMISKLWRCSSSSSSSSSSLLLPSQKCQGYRVDDFLVNDDENDEDEDTKEEEEEDDDSDDEDYEEEKEEELNDEQEQEEEKEEELNDEEEEKEEELNDEEEEDEEEELKKDVNYEKIINLLVTGFLTLKRSIDELKKENENQKRKRKRLQKLRKINV